MQRGRLRILAMVVATVGLLMLGDPRPAAADLLVTVTASGTTSTFDSASNTAFPVPSFSIGGLVDGYKDVVIAITTNFTGSAISGISTGITLSPLSTTPETISVQVQLVNSLASPPANSTNALWALPSSSPVLVSAGSSFVPQTGALGGTVATSTYFNSTASAATTGLTGAPVTTSTPIPGVSGNTVGMLNPSGSYTLSQTVTLSSFVVSSAGTPYSFGGTSSVTGVPEPSSMAIAGIGALGMIGYGLRRRKALYA